MGFEPTNGGFADQSWFSILLVRLAFTPADLADFGPDLGLIVWDEPLDWRSFLDPASGYCAQSCCVI